MTSTSGKQRGVDARTKLTVSLSPLYSGQYSSRYPEPTFRVDLSSSTEHLSKHHRRTQRCISQVIPNQGDNDDEPSYCGLNTFISQSEGRWEVEINLRNNMLYMACKSKAWGKASRKSLGTQYKKDCKPSMGVQTWNPCTQKPRPEDSCKFKASLSYTVRFCFKITRKRRVGRRRREKSL